MPLTLRSALLLMCLAPQMAAAQAPRVPDARLDPLEQAWHDCVRAAFARQPQLQSRAASQRSALDECQAQEDALVAAAMTEVEARSRDQRGDPGQRPALAERGRAWVAALASDVIDPVSSWFGRLRR